MSNAGMNKANQIDALTIMPAGAGAGKTFSIQHRIAEWVEKEWVRPERIMAVTFTNAAAAELRERIRAQLVENGRIAEAQSLNRAYITTIHGFGLRIVSEFAFEAGIPPVLRKIDEEQATRMLSHSVRESRDEAQLFSDLEKHGYRGRYDGDGYTPAAEVFKNRLRDVVGKLRSIGHESYAKELLEPAESGIRKRYGVTLDRNRYGQTMAEDLHRAVRNLLDAYPENMKGCLNAANKKGEQEFTRDHRNLKRAGQYENLSGDWRLWNELRKLRTTKRGSSVPEDYLQLAEAVMAKADQLPFHPGPLAQQINHARMLIETAMQVMQGYGEHKRESGLLDYADMISLANRLMEEKPEILAEIGNRIDCLVIDEFQDTNPLQFHLLWKLHHAGIPTLVVGDVKQSIMSVQDAEPFLMRTLQAQNPQTVEPLRNNWRSAPPLMNWINAVGAGLFGQEYDALEPRSECAGVERAVECLLFSRPEWNGRTSSSGNRARALGFRLSELLEDPLQQVCEKGASGKRRLQAGDMAVLCPTNQMVKQYADAFRSMGLKVCVEEPGWISSEAVQIALHLLEYVANPEDRHAALYLSVTALGDQELREALDNLLFVEKKQRKESLLLDALREASASIREMKVDVALDEIFRLSGLFDVLAVMDQPARERANLLRLQDEARFFVNSPREALESAGFFGNSLSTFIPWIRERAEAVDTKPRASSIDEHAVNVLTWHKSKGLEWPLVVLAGVNKKIEGFLPGLRIEYGQTNNLESILRDAHIEYFPEFDAGESNRRFLEELLRKREEETLRLLYVALTRAKERLVLEWPAYLNQVTAKQKSGNEEHPHTYWSLLQEKAKMRIDEAESLMLVDEKRFQVRMSIGVKKPAAINRDAEVELPLVRSLIQREKQPENLTPEQITPSSAHGISLEEPLKGPIKESSYGPGLKEIIPKIPVERGARLHKCFEILLNHPETVKLIESVVGEWLNTEEMLRIENAAHSLRQWMEQNYKVDRIETEVPLLGMDQKGSVIRGTADMLVYTKQGVLIVDHKSDICNDYNERFSQYLDQLTTYKKALESAQMNVIGVGVNWLADESLFYINS